MTLRSVAAAFSPSAWVAMTAVATRPGREFDALALEGFRALPPSWGDHARSLLEGLDAWAPLVLVVGFTASAILIWLSGLGVAIGHSSARIGASLVAGGVVAVMAKRLLPDVPETDVALVGNSLPSGHVYAFTAASVLLAAHAAPRRNGKSGRSWVLALLTGSSVAFAVLVLVSIGHRTSDVIVSLLMVEAVVAIASNERASHWSTLLASCWVVTIVAMGTGAVVGRGAAAQLVALATSVCFVGAASVGVAVSLERSWFGHRTSPMAGERHWLVASGSS